MAWAFQCRCGQLLGLTAGPARCPGCGRDVSPADRHKPRGWLLVTGAALVLAVVALAGLVALLRPMPRGPAAERADAGTIEDSALPQNPAVPVAETGRKKGATGRVRP